MKNNNRKVFDSLISRTKIYLVIILVLLIVICIQNTKWIVPSIAVMLLVMGYTYFANNKRKNEISETLQDLTISVDSAAKSTLINSPFPLIILETDGNIIWRSSKFVSEFENIEMDPYLDEIMEEIKKDIENSKNIDKHAKIPQYIEQEMAIGDKIYRVIGKYVHSSNKEKKAKKEYMLMVYFIDITENTVLQQKYIDTRSCVEIISIDNYEENMQLVDAEEKPQIIAEIDKAILEWTNQTNGVLIKTEHNRYICVFEQRYLETVKEDKFSILDKIKEINTKEKIPFTLSIAISNEGDTDREKYKSAQTAMDLVLGRGGDQAVIRENETYRFFGGRAQEVEKRTKVKARIVAQALEDLIKEADKVMIMGHVNPDIDVMGSSMGIYRLARSLDKNAYIIHEVGGSALENFETELSKEPEYEDVLISKEVALENIEENTWLVVVDTHKRNFVEAPELLERIKKVVVIDHHRRSEDYIEDATLTFQEVYASSAAELVTELLQYAETDVELKTIEAESLYAGIMMDTKNFTFKTGVRTFEAAAYLRKCGVDIIRVKKWFQSDLLSFNKIAGIVKSAEMVTDTIAVAINEDKDKDSNVVCAKAADELLTISNITASFVLGYLDEKICISGRSIGDINVQVILEKLGGGGHITLAGAQVEGMSMEEVKALLIEKIHEYFEEQQA